jgi:hypothetical protein
MMKIKLVRESLLLVLFLFSMPAFAVPSDLMLARASKLTQSLSDQFSISRLNWILRNNLPGHELVYFETDQRKVSFDLVVEQRLDDGFKALALFVPESSDFIIIFGDDTHGRLVHLTSSMSLTDSPFLDESAHFFDLLNPMQEPFEMPSDERLLRLVGRTSTFYKDAVEALRRKMGYFKVPRVYQRVGKRLCRNMKSSFFLPSGVTTVMTGYSMGGALVQLAMLSDEDFRDEEEETLGVTFNAPGVLEFAFRKDLIKDPEILNYQKSVRARYFTWMDSVWSMVGWANVQAEQAYLQDVLGFASVRLNDSFQIRNIGRAENAIFTRYGLHVGEVDSRSGDLLNLVTMQEALLGYVRHYLVMMRNLHPGSAFQSELEMALADENYAQLYELIFCKEARQRVYHQALHQHSLDLLIEMIARELE